MSSAPEDTTGKQENRKTFKIKHKMWKFGNLEKIKMPFIVTSDHRSSTQTCEVETVCLRPTKEDDR